MAKEKAIETPVGITEARSRIGKLVDKVQYRGETMVLTKNGKPAAAIIPYNRLGLLESKRKEAFAALDHIRQDAASDPNMSEDELMEFVSGVVQEIR